MDSPWHGNIESWGNLFSRTPHWKNTWFKMGSIIALSQPERLIPTRFQTILLSYTQHPLEFRSWPGGRLGVRILPLLLRHSLTNSQRWPLLTPLNIDAPF